MQSAAEALAVALSPIVAFFVLRIRAMSPPGLPDPSMHTTFIIDPHDIFLRYAAVFSPTSRLREASRVAFLVPARASYLLFGAIPGFYVLRYCLVLLAVVSVYVLLRRLYGRAAGALGIAVVMTSPVLVTAWGTDYPDSAAVSYLIGAFCCLALSLDGRRRSVWLVAGGILATASLWAHLASGPLLAAMFVFYVVVRLMRSRKHLLSDLLVLGATALSVTGLLMIGSRLLIGPWNFISPTIAAERFLSTKQQESRWHSTSRHWAPYVTYLLVPPAIAVAWFAAFARRTQNIGTAQLFVGLTCIGEVIACVCLQFFGSVQMLEMHYFSSLLWSSICVTLALVVAEICRPLWSHLWLRWLVPATFIVVTLVSEALPGVPSFGWSPYGAVTALALVGAAGIGRLVGFPRTGEHRRRRTSGAVTIIRSPKGALRAGLLLVPVVLIAVSGLVLTDAGIPLHRRLPNTVVDPPPDYAHAFGGPSARYVGEYRVTTEIPGFVGHATYAGEQLLMWWPFGRPGLLGPIGIYHAGFDSVPSRVGPISSAGRNVLYQRRPAEILLMSPGGRRFKAAVASLQRYGADVVRKTVLRSNGYILHLWLIDLRAFMRHSQRH
ncbi:MAG: hypothetical protein ACRDZP_08990 [Acidimicrobiales bacterium]